MIRLPPVAARVFAAFALLFAAVFFATGAHAISILAVALAAAIFVFGGPTKIIALRAADQFALERGGMVPALRQNKSYPLSTVVRAELHSWIGTKDSLGTKVVLKFADGEWSDVVSGDSLGRNVRVIEAINRFISRGRFGLPSGVDVFSNALGQTSGTVILVDGDDARKYLLFPVTPQGLMFFWPRAGIEINVGGSFEQTIEGLLRERGASSIATTSSGVTAMFGHDTNRPEAFAQLVFERVYKKPNVKFIASFSPRVYLRSSAPSSR